MVYKKQHLILYKDHEDDLRKSGLHIETIRDAGLYSKNAIGYLADRGAKSLLVFPYKYTRAGKFNRMKLFPAITDHTGHEQKYHVSKGSRNHLYITDSAFEIRNDISKPLYITEGEKKALALHQNGFPAIGISGLWNWKNRENDELIHDFSLFEFSGRPIYLIPDNDYEDKKHNGGLKIAVNRLADRLTQQGANVRLICLPVGKEKGVDDYLRLHKKAFPALMAKALPVGTKMKNSLRDEYRISSGELEEYSSTGKPIQYLDIKDHKCPTVFCIKQYNLLKE